MAVLRGMIKAASHESLNDTIEKSAFKDFDKEATQRVIELVAELGLEPQVMKPEHPIGQVFDESLDEAKYYGIDLRKIIHEVNNPVCIFCVAVRFIRAQAPQEMIDGMPKLKSGDYVGSSWVSGNDGHLLACVIGTK